MNKNKPLLNSENDKALNLFNVLCNIHLTDEDFSTYLEGKANSFNLARINIHLRRCEHCYEEMEMLKAVVSCEPGEPDPERTAELKKILAFYPVQLPEDCKEHAEKKAIGTIPGSILKHAVLAKTKSEWSFYRNIEEKNCRVYFKKDNQGNLIFKFIISQSPPKSIQLKGLETWECKLFKQEGTDWVTEIIIPNEHRDQTRFDDLGIFFG